MLVHTPSISLFANKKFDEGHSVYGLFGMQSLSHLFDNNVFRADLTSNHFLLLVHLY